MPIRAQCIAALVWSDNLRNIKHHGFVVTMVRTRTFMDEDAFEFIGVFLVGRILITKESVHVKHNRE